MTNLIMVQYERRVLVLMLLLLWWWLFLLGMGVYPVAPLLVGQLYIIVSAPLACFPENHSPKFDLDSTW